MKIKQAFTLIELLVVIAIIGILSGLIVVSMNGITSKAMVAKSQVFSNSLKNALMANLVSEWKFDEGSGQVIEDTWGANEAFLGSGSSADNYDPTWTASDCLSNNCLFFNNSTYSQVVTVPDSDSLTFSSDTADGPFTFELWIKTGDANTIINMITKDGEYYLTANYNLRLYITDSSNSSALQAMAGALERDNKWKHIVVVYTGSGASSGIYFYQNAVKTGYVEPGSGTYTRMRNGSNNLVIGGGNSPGVYMDNVRIYKAAVPVSKIKEQYYAGLNSLYVSGQLTKEEYTSRINNLAYEHQTSFHSN